MPVPRSRLVVLPVLLALAALLAAACGPGEEGPSPTAQSSTPPTADDALTERLARIDDAVNRWRAASDLAAAKLAAEEARNLVVGPDGPYYGDANEDGTIEGASPIGLLPGLAGEPGLASPAAGPCVERDVLGGSWDDPAARWDLLEGAINAWSPTNNPFPTLPSHPQRIVGWASLALASLELADALEYGGHAHLHIDVATQAATACAG